MEYLLNKSPETVSSKSHLVHLNHLADALAVRAHFAGHRVHVGGCALGDLQVFEKLDHLPVTSKGRIGAHLWFVQCRQQEVGPGGNSPHMALVPLVLDKAAYIVNFGRFVCNQGCVAECFECLSGVGGVEMAPLHGEFHGPRGLASGQVVGDGHSRYHQHAGMGFVSKCQENAADCFVVDAATACMAVWLWSLLSTDKTCRPAANVRCSA